MNDESLQPPVFRRGIRSFVLRAGRTTEGQAKALETLGPRWVLPFAPRPLDYKTTFLRDAPTVLEIGFGMGEATAHIAAVRPADNFIACEVHPPGVGALLMRIEAMALSNLRLMRHDAVEVLQRMVPPGSLAGVHLYFPDPWHKTRHHKRRLVQASFAALVADRLAPGGYWHCATDWEPYAQQMLEVMGAEPRLLNTAAGFVRRPEYRPETKFERRGLRLGHGVRDLVFRRR